MPSILLTGAGDQSRTWARPLPPVTLALMAGLVAGELGLRLPGIWAGLGLVGLWLLLALAWGAARRMRLLPLVWFWLLGVALYGQALEPSFPAHHLVHLPLDQDLVLAGRLDRAGRAGPDRTQFSFMAEAWQSPQGWRPAIGRLLVTAPGHELLPPVGTEVVLKGRLQAPRSLNNPGAVNRGRNLAAEGIFRQLSLRHEEDLVVLAGREATPLKERLRGGIRQLLAELPPALKAMYLAMLLGDQGEITPEMRRSFSRTGTSHLLVINGMHLSMVAAVAYFLSFWLLRRFPWLLLRVNAMKIATCVSAGPVMAYAWMAGGSPSTQRAEIMVLAYLLLVFLGRPREVWSALALAALVILAFKPLRLFSVSFQLSFVAVGAILYFVPRWLPAETGQARDRGQAPGWGARLWRRGREALTVSFAASLATAPLVAAYFQVVSLLGVLVNLVAIPLVLALALPLGEAAVLAQSLGITAVARAFLFLGKFPLWLGWEAISRTAALPGSALVLATPTWLQIVLLYALLLLLFSPRRSYLTWGGALLAGMALVTTAALPAFLKAGSAEVTCLDSPAGLEGVIVTPEGRRLVFSAGWPAWPGRLEGTGGVLAGYLHWRQFQRLDEVVALALTGRNASGVLALAEQFELGPVWLAGGGDQSPAVIQVRNLLGDLGRPARSLERGRPLAELGSVGLKYESLPGGKAAALLVDAGGRRVLLLPPLSQAVAETLDFPGLGPLEVLVSSQEPSPGALVRLQPHQVIIYGRERGRGESGGEIGTGRYLTREGAVTISLGEGEATVKQWRRN